MQPTAYEGSESLEIFTFVLVQRAALGLQEFVSGPPYVMPYPFSKAKLVASKPTLHMTVFGWVSHCK